MNPDLKLIMDGYISHCPRSQVSFYDYTIVFDKGLAVIRIFDTEEYTESWIGVDTDYRITISAVIKDDEYEFLNWFKLLII